MKTFFIIIRIFYHLSMNFLAFSFFRDMYD